MAKRTTRESAVAIFEALRDRICLLDYPPGMVLRETELAREFGVSRTPIRAVLQRLSHAGLIESRDGVGTIVTAPSFQEIHDIYQVRIRLAELIGSLDPLPIRPEHVDPLRQLQARSAVLLDRFDVREYWQINHDLHFLIAGIIGNRAFREIWDHLYFQTARMWYRHARSDPAGVATALVAELAEVGQAMEANDATALGYVQRNHIAYGFARLEAARPQAGTDS